MCATVGNFSESKSFSVTSLPDVEGPDGCGAGERRRVQGHSEYDGAHDTDGGETHRDPPCDLGVRQPYRNRGAFRSRLGRLHAAVDQGAMPASSAARSDLLLAKRR